MSRALSPSISRRYGLARVGRVWNVSRAGVYRFRSDTRSDTIARRPGPIGACSDAELAEHIRRQIINSGFHGEGYRKIWARLRFAGVRASPRRVRRVMGEHGLLAAHRAGRAEAKAHDGTIVTDNVNEMWGTDMTQTITIGEGRAYVFVAVEHANSEVVGIHAARSANRFEALEPVRQGLRGCFGAIAPGVLISGHEARIEEVSLAAGRAPASCNCHWLRAWPRRTRRARLCRPARPCKSRFPRDRWLFCYDRAGWSHGDQRGSCRTPVSGVFRLHPLPGLLSNGAL